MVLYLLVVAQLWLLRCVALLPRLPAKREAGQGLVEYALIITLIAIVVIGVMRLIGINLFGIFGSIACVLKAQPGANCNLQ
ncbi:MAG TPA: hypothetical protein VFS21_13085 [Roseiflexaceae bacterium]|nr:hypothetical protein [Roseiflexaceae bacterium]